jgi:hypothetical protein
MAVLGRYQMEATSSTQLARRAWAAEALRKLNAGIEEEHEYLIRRSSSKSVLHLLF